MAATYDDSMFKDTFEHEYTWQNGFLRNVRRFSSKKALIDPETDRVWTYGDLNKEANKLANALSKIGVEAYGENGDSFDPNFHNAVMHVEDEELGENVITDVFQKGYKIGDRVIRPAMVKTAN